MTLIELHKRIAYVIAQNELSPERAERNHMPLGIALATYGKTRKNGRRSYRVDYRSVKYLQAVMHTVGERKYGALVIAEEREMDAEVK